MANSRRAIAEKLLKLQSSIAREITQIDTCKEQLREIAESEGGFTEEIEGLGAVEVKGGTEKKFKGLVPTLHPEAFMALSEKQRGKLADQGLVTMEQDWSAARRPSVTVRA